jgi:hypothetical protein
MLQGVSALDHKVLFTPTPMELPRYAESFVRFPYFVIPVLSLVILTRITMPFRSAGRLGLRHPTLRGAKPLLRGAERG